MKTFKIYLAALLWVAFAAVVYAGGASSGTQMTDANSMLTSALGLDTSKTITVTSTGTKPAFINASTAGGTHQLVVTCINAATGASAVGRMKINGAGTEIPVLGSTQPFVVPKAVTFLAFNKYSTATATDSVKCTAYGN